MKNTPKPVKVKKEKVEMKEIVPKPTAAAEVEQPIEMVPLAKEEQVKVPKKKKSKKAKESKEVVTEPVAQVEDTKKTTIELS